MRKGIIMRLQGGLGNQLFQYAAGSSVAARLGCELMFDVSLLEQTPAMATPRQFELASLVSESRLVRLKQPNAVLTRLRTSKYKCVAEPMQRSSRRFYEGGRGFDPRIEKTTNGTILSGYFQSFRYFERDRRSLSEKLYTPLNPSAWFREWAEVLEGTRSSVAVHVRRGDYLAQPVGSPHSPLGTDYYERSLSCVRRHVRQPHFFVFSDDGSVDVEALGLTECSVHVLTPPRDLPTIEALQLMSRARTIVSANSSFGWWAAWLGNECRQAKVYLPSPWYRNSADLGEDMRIRGSNIVKHDWIS